MHTKRTRKKNNPTTTTTINKPWSALFLSLLFLLLLCYQFISLLAFRVFSFSSSFSLDGGGRAVAAVAASYSMAGAAVLPSMASGSVAQATS